MPAPDLAPLGGHRAACLNWRAALTYVRGLFQWSAVCGHRMAACGCWSSRVVVTCGVIV